MVDLSNQSSSTESSYNDAGDIPLGAKVGYAIVAFVGFWGLVGCLGEWLLNSFLVMWIWFSILNRLYTYADSISKHKLDDLRS